MSTGRKISVRKVVQTLVTLIVVTGGTLAMLSADRQHRSRKLQDVTFSIHSPGGVQFLTEDMVRQTLFTKRHLNPAGLKVAQLDERSMEAILQSNPWVRKAQVYTDAERIMHVSVVQRVPQVRLFEVDGNSYYLDADLKSMPLSTDYTHYVPVVTGVPRLRNDSVSTVVKGTILGLVRHIGGHPFWKAQISQIGVRPDGGFELVPVLGKQRIIIGDTAGLEEKLENLFAFYRQVHNKVGWDKYTTIDLRYKGQVVASPALKWKAPVDRAISNMNWLKAIMENAPAQLTRPGGDASAIPDSPGHAAAPMPAAAVVAAPKPVVQAAGTKPALKAPARPAAKPAARPTANAARNRDARPAGRTAVAPGSRAPKTAKPAPRAPQKKPTNQPAKNTTSHAKNTKSHAATNR